jgi:translation initiation factor IF-2
MFRKIVDVLKEVFWIKTSRKRPKPVRRKTAKRSTLKKKAVKAAQKPVSKPLAKPAVKASKAIKEVDPNLVQLGVITHYFDRIKVCVVKLTQGTVLIGDKLTIQGVKTKFVQKVWSMQIESEDVKVAKKGQVIGLKVDKIVAVGDKVYK